MSDFQQTVDLKQKMEAAKQPKPAAKKKVAPPAPKSVKERSRAEEIDRVFRPEKEEPKTDANIGKFDMPKPGRSYDGVYKTIIFLLLAIILAGTVMYIRKDEKAVSEAAVSEQKDLKWYSVKLVTDEIFYGQIADTAADPITIQDVYYNYDQLKEGDVAEGSPNLRLVKRGKETYGPEGNMDIVRSQVVYMEPLKSDSKVLKAILDNEN